MGGSYHALLLQAALAGGVGLLVFFGLLAATGANTAVTERSGSRLTERLPSYGPLLLAAAAWYGVAECLEPLRSSPSDRARLLRISARVDPFFFHI